MNNQKSIKLVIFTFFCSFTLLNAKPSINEFLENKAQIIYLQNIKIIKKFINDKGTHNGNQLDEAIFFLEELTNIKSDYSPGQEIFYIPSKQNLKDWKKWYRKNKHKLYWDEKEQKVKLRE